MSVEQSNHNSRRLHPWGKPGDQQSDHRNQGESKDQSVEQSDKPRQSASAQHHRPSAKPQQRPLPVYLRYYLPQRLHRPIIRLWRLIDRWTGGGDWYWIAQKPLPLRALNRSLWRGADASINYYIMLFLSGVISTLGLLAGSAAAIIGAMIVAPLMGPITAMAFAMTMGNRRLLRRSSFSVVTGALMTVVTAYVICEIIGISTLNSEILSRTRPTLIDLAIGLAAGAAGAFAKTRREVADALPGVAIAVALVPPLSVIGIGLSLSLASATGATLLFLTNLAGIVLSGGLVFVWQEYSSLRRARQGLIASTVMLLMLAVPLGFSMRELIIEEKTRSSISYLIRRKTLTFSESQIRSLQTDVNGRQLEVTLEVAAPVGSISQKQVRLVRDFLEAELDRPIDLRVGVLPMEEFSAGGNEIEASGQMMRK